MNEQYYYLVVSLPELAFDQPPPLTTAEFLNRCEGQLPEDRFRLLEKATLFQEKPAQTPLAMLNRWYQFEHALRNALARERGRRLDRDPLPSLRGDAFDADAQAVAGRVLELASPWAAEEQLDLARWKFLDELEVENYFNLEKLVIYLLKLKILERRASFSEETGRKKLEAFQTAARELSGQP